MENSTSISTEIIMNKVYTVRGQQVMLDYDAAELYDVDRKTLIRSVNRNFKRFPPDFLYSLSEQEWANLKIQINDSTWATQTSPPLAFTTGGLLMLSGVLKSKRAAQVSVLIINSLFSFRNV